MNRVEVWGVESFDPDVPFPRPASSSRLSWALRLWLFWVSLSLSMYSGAIWLQQFDVISGLALLLTASAAFYQSRKLGHSLAVAAAVPACLGSLLVSGALVKVTDPTVLLADNADRTFPLAAAVLLLFAYLSVSNVVPDDSPTKVA